MSIIKFSVPVLSMAGFAELGLSSWLVEQCRQLGLKQPTPVQLGCIPAILEGESSFPAFLCPLFLSPICAPRVRGVIGCFGNPDPAALAFRLQLTRVHCHTGDSTSEIFVLLEHRESLKND